MALSKQMQCLIKAYDKKGLWLSQRPIPSPQAFEVLIKVHYVAICGSDLHIYSWNKWAQDNVPLNLITGHEFSGEIIAFGSHAQTLNPSLKKGDMVSAEGHITCGYCRNCRAGNQHYCKETVGIGVNRNGAFAEYISVPINNIYKIPNTIDPKLASIFDPFGNAMHTCLHFDIRGEDVLITGAGPIGCMSVAIAKFCGARKIIISDLNDQRLALAKNMGATDIWNPNSKIPLTEIMQKNNIKEGFDVSLEMSGSTNALLTIIDHAITGGSIALLGIMPENSQINWNNIIFKSLKLHGIYGRQMFESWYKMGAMIQAGLDITPVISHTMPFKDFQNGFDLLLQGKAAKVILKF